VYPGLNPKYTLDEVVINEHGEVETVTKQVGFDFGRLVICFDLVHFIHLLEDEVNQETEITEVPVNEGCCY